jgi:putative transposase
LSADPVTQRRHPAIVKLWENAWAEFVPFLAFDVEIRKVICSTTAIESVNARIRKAVPARGHFPNEQAALKCVYLALLSLDPTGAGHRRWTMRWKAPPERVPDRVRRPPHSDQSLTTSTTKISR